jgi:hypothetical protein
MRVRNETSIIIFDANEDDPKGALITRAVVAAARST